MGEPVALRIAATTGASGAGAKQPSLDTHKQATSSVCTCGKPASASGAVEFLPMEAQEGVPDNPSTGLSLCLSSPAELLQEEGLGGLLLEQRGALDTFAAEGLGGGSGTGSRGITPRTSMDAAGAVARGSGLLPLASQGCYSCNPSGFLVLGLSASLKTMQHIISTLELLLPSAPCALQVRATLPWCWLDLTTGKMPRPLAAAVSWQPQSRCRVAVASSAAGGWAARGAGGWLH